MTSSEHVCRMTVLSGRCHGLVEDGEMHPDLDKMGNLHLNKPKLRGSNYMYFCVMNQRKQEPRVSAYFGALHLDNQFQNLNISFKYCLKMCIFN